MGSDARLAQRMYTTGVRALGRLPAQWLRGVDRVIQAAQGKGWYGAGTQEEVDHIRVLLQPSLNTPALALDVGANLGDWTFEFLQRYPESRVICFEPSTTASARLRERFDGDPRVQVERIALSNKNGEAELWSDVPGSALASLSQRDLGRLGIHFSGSEAVPLATLDDWMQQHQLGSIDVLKIDVEGHELAVLVGATRALDVVRVVQFEFGGCGIDSRVFFRDIWTLLMDRGFRVFRMGPAGLVEIAQYSEREESFLFANYLAIKAPS